MTPRLYHTVLNCRFRSRSVDRSIASRTKRASSCRWVAGWAGRRAPRVGAHVGCRPSGPWSERKSAWDWSTVPPRSGTRAAGSVRTLRSRPFPARQPILVQFLAGSPSQGHPSLVLLPFSLSPSSGRKEGRVLLRAACCCIRTVCSPSVSACVCARVLSERAGESCSPACSSCSWTGRTGSSFFFFYCIPPVAPHRRPLLFPSLHRESLTVSPPNRLVAESTDSLPSSPFLPSPLLYVLTTVTPLKSPLCAFPANSRSPFNPSGRPIYILSANAKIPPRLNPLHLALPRLALPCHCTNGERLRSRISVSNDLNPLPLRLFNYLLLPTLHCTALPSIRLSVLAIGPGRHSLLVTCLSLLLHIPYIITSSRLPRPRTADPRYITSLKD